MNSPLNERDFAEIRANVLREIARREKRSNLFLAGAVVFAAIALVFVLIPRPKEAGRIAGPTQKQPAARLSVAPAILPAAPRPPLIAAASRPKRHKHTHRHHQPMTIEMHTANPDVRIIWIAK